MQFVCVQRRLEGQRGEERRREAHPKVTPEGSLLPSCLVGNNSNSNHHRTAAMPIRTHWVANGALVGKCCVSTAAYLHSQIICEIPLTLTLQVSGLTTSFAGMLENQKKPKTKQNKTRELMICVFSDFIQMFCLCSCTSRRIYLLSSHYDSSSGVLHRESLPLFPFHGISAPLLATMPW